MNVFDLSAKIALDINGYLKGMDTAKGVAISTLSVIGGALGQFMDQSIEVGKKFDSSMSQVSATMGDKANDSIQYGNQMMTASEALRDFALETGRTTMYTASECADALNYMALAGYDATQSMEMLPNVLNLASAGSMDLARASDMVTDTQTAFGISTTRVTRMIDEMAKASSTGNTSVEQMGDAFLVVGGLAQDLNGGLVTLADGTTATVDGVQELEIALTAMANAGIKGSEAGTHMRNMLLKLSSPTKEGADQLEALGVKVFDSEGKMRSLKDIIKDLGVSLESLSQEQKTQAIAKIFNARDIASAEALLSAIGGDWNKIGEAIIKADGAAGEMARKKWDNLAGDTKKFESALEGLQIALSDGATPAIRKMTQFGTEAITELTDVFKGLPEEAQTAIAVIADFGGKALSMTPQVISLGGSIAQMGMGMKSAGLSASSFLSFLNPVTAAVGLAAVAITAAAYTYFDYKQRIEEAAAEEREFADQMEQTKNAYESQHDQLLILLSGQNEYMSAQERASQLESQRVQIANEQIAVQQEIDEKQAQLKETTDKLAAAQEELNKANADGGWNYKMTTEEIEGMKLEQEELTRGIEAANAVYDQTTEDLNAINAALDEVEQEQVQQKQAVEETSAAYQLFGHDVHESMQNAASKVVASVLEMQDALTGSVNSIGNWFDDVQEIQKADVGKMKTNLNNQIQLMKNWESDIAFLSKQGIDDEFLKYLAKMGPEGYKYVLAMKEDVISGGQDTVDEWNALYKEKLELEQGINDEAQEVYDAVATMEAGGVQHLEAMAKAFNLEGENVGEGVTLGFINKLNDAVTSIKEAGEKDGEASIDGMEDGTDSHSPSRKAMTVGKNVGEGLLQGLNNQKGAIKAAGQALGRAAVEGITGQQGAVSTFGATIGRAVVSGINSYQSAVSGAGRNLAQSVLNGANSVNLQGNGYNIGMYFVLGMRNGIYDYSHAALSAAQSVAYNMMNSVRSIMRIGSPSKVAEYFGEMWDAGLEEGITVNAEAPVEATKAMTENVVGATRQGLIAPSLDYNGYAQDVSEAGTVGTEEPVAPFNVTMNIYGSEGQDVRELAMIVGQELAMIMRENQAVWA